MQCTSITVVLNAMQRLSIVSTENVDADINGLKPSSLLLLAVAPTGRHDNKDHMTITRISKFLQKEISNILIKIRTM